MCVSVSKMLQKERQVIFVKKDSIRQIGKIYQMVKGEISPLTQEELEQM